MAEVVLDANVLVGWLDDGDALAADVATLAGRLRADGYQLVLLDVCVNEAVSVLCRRSRERKTKPPDLVAALFKLRRVAQQGGIRFVAKEAERLLPEVLDLVEVTGGVLNFNDALLAVLQREGTIAEVASFDQGLDAAPGFKRIA